LISATFKRHALGMTELIILNVDLASSKIITYFIILFKGGDIVEGIM